jgi:hypothetical protein
MLEKENSTQIPNNRVVVRGVGTRAPGAPASAAATAPSELIRDRPALSGPLTPTTTRPQNVAIDSGNHMLRSRLAVTT